MGFFGFSKMHLYRFSNDNRTRTNCDTVRPDRSRLDPPRLVENINKFQADLIRLDQNLPDEIRVGRPETKERTSSLTKYFGTEIDLNSVSGRPHARDRRTMMVMMIRNDACLLFLFLYVQIVNRSRPNNKIT